jgi:hypothetical protein
VKNGSSSTPSAYTPSAPLTYQNGQWTPGGASAVPATTQPVFQHGSAQGTMWSNNSPVRTMMNETIQRLASAHGGTTSPTVNPQTAGQGGYQNGPVSGAAPQPGGSGGLGAMLSNPTSMRLMQALMGKANQTPGQAAGWGANIVPASSIGGGVM